MLLLCVFVLLFRCFLLRRVVSFWFLLVSVTAAEDLTSVDDVFVRFVGISFGASLLFIRILIAATRRLFSGARISTPVDILLSPFALMTHQNYDFIPVLRECRWPISMTTF
jgi:hypothetical protein